MANNGTLTTGSITIPDTGGRNKYLQLTWTAAQSIENNTSTISWTLTTSGTYPYWVYYSKTRVVIDGQTVYWREAKTQQEAGTIANGTITLAHNSVGERSFTASISAGIYDHATNATATGTFTLNPIPRASSVTASGLEFGVAGSLEIHRASADFTDGIHYHIGDVWGSIVADEAPTSATTISWTPPASLMEQIPAATSATVQIIAHTFNGATMIAERVSEVTVSVPTSIVPVVSASSITLTNTDTTFGSYAQSISAVRVQTTASGQYGATIAAYTVTFEGSTYSGADVTTNIISGSGTLPVKVKVSDSRGRSTTVTKNITVQAYSTPRMEFSAHRCDSGGTADDMGAYVDIWIHGTASAVTNNVVTLSLQKRQAGTSAWTSVDISSYITVTSNTDKTVNNAVIAADDTKSWEYQATVTDLLNGVTQTVAISVGYATIDFFKGGRGVAFGTTASGVGFTCAMDANFTGDMILSGLRIRAGSKLFQPSASTDAQLFTFSELNTLFGTNDCTNENTVVYASNGDIAADAQGGNKVITGTYNTTTGVYMRSAVAFSGSTIRVNYIAIHF